MLRFGMCVAALIGILASAPGCSICQAPDDCAYSAYGGVYPRADMYNGRVGSAFAPAEGGIVAGELGSTIVTEPEPAEPEEAAPELPEEDLEEGQGLQTGF